MAIQDVKRSKGVAENKIYLKQKQEKKNSYTTNFEPIGIWEKHLKIITKNPIESKKMKVDKLQLYKESQDKRS